MLGSQVIDGPYVDKTSCCREGARQFHIDRVTYADSCLQDTNIDSQNYTGATVSVPDQAGRS